MNSPSQTRRRFFMCVHVISGLALSALTNVAPARAQVPGLTWTPWVDPAEKAFTVQAPSGWTVSGGLVRNGDSNFRQSVQAFVSANDLMVQIGDSGLPPFVAPSADLKAAGFDEGSVLTAGGGAKILVMSFLPALKFNEWYATKRLQPILDDIAGGYTREEPDLARQFTAALQKVSDTPVSVTVGETSFTGKLKAGGQPVTFVIMSTVLHNGTPGKGDETWLARPILLGWARNDRTAASKTTVEAVLSHLIVTWQDSPDWIAAYDQSQASKPGAAKAGTSPGLRASLMGTYWKTIPDRATAILRLTAFLQKLPDEPLAAPGSN